MKKFTLFNQDEEVICDTEYSQFTCSIRALKGYYVVLVDAGAGNTPAAVFRNIQEAAEAIAELEEFAIMNDEPNKGFEFALPADETVTGLELISVLNLCDDRGNRHDPPRR